MFKTLKEMGWYEWQKVIDLVGSILLLLALAFIARAAYSAADTYKSQILIEDIRSQVEELRTDRDWVIFLYRACRENSPSLSEQEKCADIVLDDKSVI